MLIFSFVFINPVTRPVKVPIIKANRSERTGFIPQEIRTAVTAPPTAKLPSTVISAMFSILNVRYTPSVISPHRIPCETAPSIASKMPICNSRKVRGLPVKICSHFQTALCFLVCII